MAIATTLPRHVISVAVMQNPPGELAERWQGTWIQLHGAEDEALVERIAATKHVIKGFRFDPDEVRPGECGCGDATWWNWAFRMEAER